jgi:Kae1-associated kinase Bud32
MSSNTDLRKKLLELLHNEYSAENILASCIYGSFAAGYARANSDYDIIVILKNYRAKIGYRYIKEPLLCSILAIEQKMFLDDVRKSGLGEFVCGRFLNIYEPLEGQDFLENAESEYKKRIIMEFLMEFNGKYHPILDLIKFPLKYFLFEKLRRRALFYPPALYSYTKTYTSTSKERNLEFTLKGFKSAAARLSEENDSVIFSEDKVWVGDIKAFNKTSKLKRVMEETKRDITSYATHLYAGRVGFNIIVDELKSKIERQRKLEPIEVLKHTCNYLEIPEGRLIVNEKNWIARIAEYLGIKGAFQYKTQKIGGYWIDKIVNVAQKCTLEGDGKTYEFVIKKFNDPRNIKWAVLALVTLTDKRFEFMPLKRLGIEYRMNITFRTNGFLTPKVYALDFDRAQLATEYIKGKTVGSLLVKKGTEKLIEEVGQVIGNLHSKGLTLGDSKPDNMIYTNNGVFFIDLEQAKIGGDKTWDLAEFLNYSLAFTLNTEAAESLSYSFAIGYIKNGSGKDLEKTKELRYAGIFKPIVAPNVSKAVNVGIEKALHSKL